MRVCKDLIGIGLFGSMVGLLVGSVFVFVCSSVRLPICRWLLGFCVCLFVCSLCVYAFFFSVVRLVGCSCVCSFVDLMVCVFCVVACFRSFDCLVARWLVGLLVVCLAC